MSRPGRDSRQPVASCSRALSALCAPRWLHSPPGGPGRYHDCRTTRGHAEGLGIPDGTIPPLLSGSATLNG
eukprot:14444237-Heterocapsa_arctica.AAC.1